jgi:transposase InsO family protein
LERIAHQSATVRSSPPDDAAVRARLRELASIRRRFGYRRLQVLLRREGIIMNHKKLRRIYREERLQVRRRGGRKRALGTRMPIALPQGPNQQRWSWTFCRMPSWTAGASASSRSSMTSRENAWSWCLTGLSVFLCEAVIRHEFTKRSLNMTANCVFASAHSRGGRFHSAAALFKTKYSSFVAASSEGKCPLVLTAGRSLELSASMAFVV